MGLARLAGRRRLRRPARQHHRRCRRPGGRLLRRPCRCHAHARHGRDAVVSGDSPRADPGRYCGPELRQRRDRDLGDSLGAVCARRPRAGADADDARLHRPGAHRGRGRVADHHAAPAPEHAQHARRAHRAAGRLRDHRGGVALVPRCRHSAADPGLGLDDRRGARLRDERLVGVLLSRARDSPRRARLQPARRLAARHAGPEAAPALTRVSSVIDVRDLRTHIVTRWGTIKAVDGVSFALGEAETVGLVGESGSGKSMTCLSLVRLVPRPAARIVGGEVLLDGENLLAKSDAEMQRIRGRKVAMILQDPMSSLNPVFSVGMQLREPLTLYHGLRGRAVAARAVELLAAVRIPSPAARLRAFPHQLSGGMRQRVVGAMAIAGPPRLLIADEPTTSLDLTIQAQYLGLLKELQQRHRFAMIFVTHNLGIVARTCDRVAVMYAGRIVETGPVATIFGAPAHPYTRLLLESVPRLGETTEWLTAIEGQPPDLAALPPGCAFAPRCPQAMDRCRADAPPEFVAGPAQTSRCWLQAPP